MQNKNEIYLIVESFFDLEPHEYIHGFCFNEKEAQEAVEKIKSFNREVLSYKEELDNKIDNFNYPTPTPQLEEKYELPKWPSGLSQKDITSEMREEKEYYKRLNEEILERNKQKLKEVDKKIEDKRNDIIESFDCNENVKNFLKSGENIEDRCNRDVYYKIIKSIDLDQFSIN